MKVLINKCYGGFGFSDDFIKHIRAISTDDFSIHPYLWNRANQFLVEEAIKFGLEKAGSIHSELEVAEIPDEAQFKISEYDGTEWIEQVWIEATLDELRNGLSIEQLSMVSQGCDIKLKH